MKNKKVLYGLVAGVILLGGVGVSVLANQPKQTVATSETTTTAVSTTQGSTTVNAVVSELSSKLNSEVTAETNVAELEQQLSQITDEKAREELAKKLDDVKQQHAVKVEEKPKDEQPTSTTVVKADEVSQPVQPTPSTPQANPTPAPQPQTTQRPVETTRQTTRQTTQATTKKTRTSPLGNSGKEFPTMDAAEDWADGLPNFPEGKHGYWILPVFYSDGSQTYTVDWY